MDGFAPSVNRIASSRVRSATDHENNPYTPSAASKAARPPKNSRIVISSRASAVFAAKRSPQVCVVLIGTFGTTLRSALRIAVCAIARIGRLHRDEHLRERELARREIDCRFHGLAERHVVDVLHHADDLRRHALGWRPIVRRRFQVRAERPDAGGPCPDHLADRIDVREVPPHEALVDDRRRRRSPCCRTR